MSKKTPWFKPGKKPARVGVYECARDSRYCGGEVLFQQWNGKFWGFFSKTVVGADETPMVESRRQNPTWRGLSEKPA